jgi:hypothetical protein
MCGYGRGEEVAVVCKHSGRGVSGSLSSDVRLEAPMRAIREASTQRKTFRASFTADTGRGFSGATRQNLSSLISVGSEDLRT